MIELYFFFTFSGFNRGVEGFGHFSHLDVLQVFSFDHSLDRMRFTHGVQISLRSIVIYIPELVQDMSNFTAFIFWLDKFHNPDDLLISLAVADGISNNAILCLFCNFKLLFFVLTMKSYDFEVRVNLVVYIFLMVGLIGR